MSALSCLDSVKTNPRNRPPSRRLRESSDDDESTSTTRPGIRPSRRSNSTRRLYNIQVIEEEQYQVKIHYVGYSPKYDEWIRRSQIKYVPSRSITQQEPDSISEHHFSVLACRIKQKLVPSRKTEDPLVKVQIPFKKSAFMVLKNAGKSLGNSRGHHIYTISQYDNLNDLLGDQWHIRIANSNGDFSVAMLETIRFYLMEPKPLLDFNATKTSTGELSLIPVYTQQQLSLVFQFVRQDGNKRKLLELL